jgi:hypothetical protein
LRSHLCARERMLLRCAPWQRAFAHAKQQLTTQLRQKGFRDSPQNR